MDTIRRPNANKNQRIEFDEVGNRYGRLSWEALNAFITGYSGARSGLLYGGLTNVSGAMQVLLGESSFFVHRVEQTKCIGIAQRKSILLDVDPETTGQPRIDIVKGRFIETVNRPKTVDVINELNGEINPLVKNTDVEVELELQVEKGTPGATPTPPELSSEAASYTSTVDFSSPVDMTSLSKVSISLNGAAFQEVNMQGANPVNTSISEAVGKINAVFPGLATQDGTYITLTATGGGDSIRMNAPSDSDATEYIFGLDISPGYLYKFERRHPWFKLAELKIAANESTELQPDEVVGPDRKKEWTAPTDPNDENDTFNQPNAEDLSEISVPLGSFAPIHKTVIQKPSPERWAFCGLAANAPADWVANGGLVQGDNLPIEFFSGSETVPQLDDDRFLMGAAGATPATGGSSDQVDQSLGSITWTGPSNTPDGSNQLDLQHNHQWYDFFSGTSPNPITTEPGGANEAARSYDDTGATKNMPDTGELLTDYWTENQLVTYDFSHNHGITSSPAGANRPQFYTVDYYLRIK